MAARQYMARAGGILLLIASLLVTGAAAAQSPASFYAKSGLTIVVGSTPGGYYDIAGRVVARHLAPFIPGNPTIIVQNLPGAAGLASGNRLANTIERDGKTIVVMSRALPQLALVGDPNAAFDPLTLTWLGSLSSYQDDAYLVIVNASHKAHSLADIAKGSGATVHLGGTAAGSTNVIFALIARDMLKLDIQLTSGYPGAAEIWLAMERGELDGQLVDISAIMVGRPTLWQEGKLRPLLAFGRAERLPSLPDVPVARELVQNPADLALLEFAELPFFMALPFVAPPDIPADRAAALRTGFMAMARDDAFRADMLKSGIRTSPIDGAAVHDLLERAAQTPAEVRARFAKLLAAK